MEEILREESLRYPLFRAFPLTSDELRFALSAWHDMPHLAWNERIRATLRFIEDCRLESL